jgi:predicted dithiol-disulfide oxidoreductase (DUF899 family)
VTDQEDSMSLPEVVSRDEWLAARTELLAKEKAHTRERDALNADRRRLPMVRVEKEYVFEGPDGKVTLADLFDGSGQLIVQHLMFDPEWENPCPGCTAFLDEMAPALLTHLRSRDTTFVGVSRAPLAKLTETAERKGWFLPWYSSFGSDFNYDFNVTLDESVAPIVYNYRPDTIEGQTAEVPGTSCFLRTDDGIYHTYSAYARGGDQLGSAYTLLDLTAFGRSEGWEEPKGRAGKLHGADPTFTD